MLRISCGHPNALVALYVTSTGKFHTSRLSSALAFRVICDIPSSIPSSTCQSSPCTTEYLQYAFLHSMICAAPGLPRSAANPPV